MILFHRLPQLGNAQAGLQLDDSELGATWDYWPLDVGRESVVATCACPNGHIASVSPKIHTIAADGTLSPSYVCPRPGCAFHDFVRFEGWKE